MKMIRVSCCADCPFFINTMGGFLAALLAIGKSDMRGECDYPADVVRHYPMGAVGIEADKERGRKLNRLKILDGSQLPKECPLQRNSVTVTLVD